MTKEQTLKVVAEELNKMLGRLQAQVMTLGDVMKADAQRMVERINAEWKDGSDSKTE